MVKQLTFDQLPNEVAKQGAMLEQIQCLLDKLVKSPNIPTSTEIVTAEQLSVKLDITRQTLARWRKQKRIPYIQVGAVIRYDLNKVVEALESNKRKGGANG